MSGKNALRKKRFTMVSSQGSRVPAPWVIGITLPRPKPSDTLRHQIGVQNAHIGQIPVSLGEIEAVADHELVRDLEADIAEGDVDLPPRRLRQEGADLEA